MWNECVWDLREESQQDDALEFDHSTMASWRYRWDETKRALKAMTWMKTERWIGMNSPCT